MVALVEERTLVGPEVLETHAAQPWLVALLRSRNFFFLESYRNHTGQIALLLPGVLASTGERKMANGEECAFRRQPLYGYISAGVLVRSEAMRFCVCLNEFYLASMLLCLWRLLKL